MSSKRSTPDHGRDQFSAFRHSLSTRDRAEIYSPLVEEDGIRLLRLLPGASKDVVAVNLVHTTLEKAKDWYHALSYCWGDLNVTEEIQCNKKALEIPANAVAFLRQLRDPRAAKLLWMDSICINQSDLDERQQQVKMMHLIFKHARHVDAWLGEEADDSALAFEYATTLNTAQIIKAFFELYETTGEINRKPASEMWIGDMQHVDQSRKEKLILAAFHVCQRPWIVRIWIQQEIVFGREISIHSGPHTIPWDQFHCLLRLCRPHDSSTWPSFEGMNRISWKSIYPALKAANSIQLRRWPSYQPDDHGPFHELIWRTLHCWGCQSSDPRDKLYALLNLVPDLSTAIIAPDYGLPWPVVFTNFSRMFYMNFDTTLELLYCAGFGLPATHERTDLPSWVIDWRDVGIDYFENKRFHAGEVHERFETLQPSFLIIPGDRLPAITHNAPFDRGKEDISAHAEALVTRALMMDKIVFIAECAHDPGIIDEEFYDLQELHNLVETGSQQFKTLPHTYLNGDLTEEVYRRTITSNLDHFKRPMTQEFCQKEWDVWQEYCRASLYDRQEPNFVVAMANARFGMLHTFATTAQGYFCLVSKSSKIGDYVLIIPGTISPVTIRKERPSDDEETELFSLVSGCYIHGMVYGEAGKMWNILDQCGGNVDRAAEALKARRAAGEEGALHENYARVLSTITSRKILIV